MENMDKGITVPKRMLINQPKIPQMPKNLSAQIVCPSAKVLNFNEKRLNWASVVCVTTGVEIEKILEKYFKIRVFFKK